MISRNYGGVELGYFFKRNFSLSTRNSRITTTRREIPATASPTFTRPFLSPLLPFLLLFPDTQSLILLPFLAERNIFDSHCPFGRASANLPCTCVTLKIARLFFFFFTYPVISHRENLFRFFFFTPYERKYSF